MSEDTTGQRHTPSPHDRVLARDVQATVIPAGEPAVLPAGTKVTITTPPFLAVSCSTLSGTLRGTLQMAFADECEKMTGASE